MRGLHSGYLADGVEKILPTQTQTRAGTGLSYRTIRHLSQKCHLQKARDSRSFIFQQIHFFRRLLCAWNFRGTGDAAMNDTDKIQPRGAHIPEWADQINKTHNMLDADKCHGEELSREGLGDVQEIMVVILNCWGRVSRRGSLK